MDLKDVKSCPMCGSQDLTTNAPVTKRPNEGWKYIATLLNMKKLETIEIASKIRTKRCAQCGILLYSPWFETHESANGFATRAARHQSGWLNLQQLLTSKRCGTIQSFNGVVSELIGNGGTINRYAELGCPFSGFNALEFFVSSQSTVKRIKKFVSSSYRQSDSRDRIHVRLFDKAANILIFFSGLGLYLEALARAAIRSSPTNVNTQLPTQKAEKYFLLQNSAFGWGAACEAFGRPCQNLAAKMFDMKLMPFADAKRDRTFDMIGIYNFFDHLSAPLETLDDCVAISRLVLFTVHRPEYAGKQHRVIITKDFATFLEARYPRVEIAYYGADFFGDFENCDQYQVFILRKIA